MRSNKSIDTDALSAGFAPHTVRRSSLTLILTQIPATSSPRRNEAGRYHGAFSWSANHHERDLENRLDVGTPRDFSEWC
ncbi:MAG: hypothetical protein JWP43_2062, partial [Ramlibacter sp.]|nr:hypothetical protein [Ramlibacter sp.]